MEYHWTKSLRNQPKSIIHGKMIGAPLSKLPIECWNHQRGHVTKLRCCPLWGIFRSNLPQSQQIKKAMDPIPEWDPDYALIEVEGSSKESDSYEVKINFREHRRGTMGPEHRNQTRLMSLIEAGREDVTRQLETIMLVNSVFAWIDWLLIHRVNHCKS